LKETEDGRQESEVDIHPNNMFIFLIPELNFLFFFASVSGLPTSDIIFDLSLNLPAAGGIMVDIQILSNSKPSICLESFK
jgi:hypothetical protein